MPPEQRAWLSAPRSMLLVFGVVAAISLSFTLLIRLYVVPQMTPQRHWQAGLVKESDSALFQEEAAALSGRMRQIGWSKAAPQEPGRTHVLLIATTYYVAGSDHPVLFYVCNALLAGISAVLLYWFMRRSHLGRVAATIGAAALCISPMFLFVHSELLREPVIIPLLLLLSVGMALATSPGGTGALFGLRASWLLGGGIALFGFWGTSQLRPYLVLPLLVGLLTTLAALWAVRLRRMRADGVRLDQLAIHVVLVCVFIGVVQQRGAVARAYREQSVLTKVDEQQRTSPPAGIREADAWKSVWIQAREADKEIDRQLFNAPRACTVQWRPSGWLPRLVDNRLQALSCARQDFLRFCSIEFLGQAADRNCDDKELQSAWDVVAHVPRAAAFGLLVPFPNMWFDGFGSGGTGLRRAGYIVDGIVAYVLLLGLPLFAWYRWQTHSDLVLLGLGLVAVVVIYALAVPTQFILARMRLGLYLPLLAMGYTGFVLAVSERVRVLRASPLETNTPANCQGPRGTTVPGNNWR